MLRSDPMSLMNYSREFLARKDPMYREIIDEFFKALDDSNFEELENMTEEDFMYLSWPLRLGRNEFFLHHRSLKSAFPDWSHHQAYAF
jgi:hypothetical protein